MACGELHVDWRYTALDIRTATASVEAIAKELARSGCGKLVVPPGAVKEAFEREGAFGGHQHRNGADGECRASRSVVDPDCRVHDLRNLFIAGSAVFPTSGQANPTLTIVALALRLAGQLKRHFAPWEIGQACWNAGRADGKGGDLT